MGVNCLVGVLPYAHLDSVRLLTMETRNIPTVVGPSSRMPRTPIGAYECGSPCPMVGCSEGERRPASGVAGGATRINQARGSCRLSATGGAAHQWQASLGARVGQWPPVVYPPAATASVGVAQADRLALSVPVSPPETKHPSFSATAYFHGSLLFSAGAVFAIPSHDGNEGKKRRDEKVLPRICGVGKSARANMKMRCG